MGYILPVSELPQQRNDAISILHKPNNLPSWKILQIRRRDLGLDIVVFKKICQSVFESLRCQNSTKTKLSQLSLIKLRCYYKLCPQDLLNEMVFCSCRNLMTSTCPANFNMFPENRRKTIGRFLIHDIQKYAW